ncbi:YcgL domain-containing protein [Marinicella sp. W31]|uniref:YcgL domain-containing protein n=1 Tax=Marinicella sp. W31 TaxID=3023713 RepID=UPI0037572C5F
MRCKIWRSRKKRGAYVYLPEAETPEVLPEALVRLLGVCDEVMSLDLAERDKLASENIDTVCQNLQQQGYHVQLPPPVINPLAE